MLAHRAARVRYPLRAVLAVIVASLLALLELAGLALFMMPMIPLVPVFVLIVIGNALFLADIVRWAASLAVVEPVREARAPAGRPRRESTQEAAPAT